MAMQCPIQNRDNADVLLKYCSRQLDPETAVILERHIAICPQCHQFADQQQLLWNTLDSWEAEPVSLDFDRRLYARIESEDNVSWWRRAFRPLDGLSFKPAFSLAAACVTVIAVILVQEPSAIDTPPQARADTAEIEQVERTLEDIDMIQQLDSLGVTVKEAAPRSL